MNEISKRTEVIPLASGRALHVETTEGDVLSETIGTFEDGGETFEIDHLSIGYDTQWGEFAVYRDGKQFTVFEIDGAGLKPEFRPELPAVDELVRQAKEAVQDERAEAARQGCPCPENQRYGTCGH